MRLAAGRRLGPYEILGPIGAGGMGEVYRARDARLERTIAVKVLPAELAVDEVYRQRFERVARAASALNHPHIAHVYDVGVDEGTHFIAMEYVEGQNLRELLSRGPLDVDRIVDFGQQMASALEEAHSRGILHRDIKSANAVVSPGGQVKLLDFGLARETVESAAALDSRVETEARTQAALVAAAAVVAGVLYWKGSRGAAIGSVAVLPFENATGDPSNDYLSDGISESLINKLANPVEVDRQVVERDRHARVDRTIGLAGEVERVPVERPGLRLPIAALENDRQPANLDLELLRLHARELPRHLQGLAVGLLRVLVVALARQGRAGMPEATSCLLSSSHGPAWGRAGRDSPPISSSGEVRHMEQRASVIVVGAGVIGCSVALQLARLGQRDVVVLEREALPGTGSTSRANGGIRAQFTTETNVRMSLLSMEILDALEEEIGQPPAYRKAGYLFLTDDPAKLAAMERAAEFQRGFGVDVEVLDAAQVRRRVAWIAGKKLVGGTFGARDGFIDPGRLCAFFASTAAHDGVAFRYGQEVIAVEESGDGFVFRTADGSAFASPVVVNAAGAWSAQLARLVGVEVPVEPVRRHLFLTGPVRELPSEIPMTIDADTGVLVRREGERVLVAWSNADEPPGFDTTCDPEFVLRFADALEARFPSVAAAGIDQKRSWAGLYEVTPDHHAILGPVPGHPGLYLATGFSGHGVMHAPAAGRCVAEMIVRGRSESVDVSALSLERFARGELIHETMVL